MSCDCKPCKRERRWDLCALSSILLFMLFNWIFPSFFQIWAVLALTVGWIPGFFYGRHLAKKNQL